MSLPPIVPHDFLLANLSFLCDPDAEQLANAAKRKVQNGVASGGEPMFGPAFEVRPLF
jgi:hypothetical protein